MNSIEWLIEELKKERLIRDDLKTTLALLINKAKEMYEQEQEEVYDHAFDYGVKFSQRENTYTLKEMRMSYEAGQDYQGRFENNLPKGKSFGDFISSLKQPKQ